MAETPPHKKTLLRLWISNVNEAYFHIPNPKILQLFIISSTATFSLGAAMIVEWFYHGQHHPSYRWIVYYAPSVVIFPIIMLIICLVSAQVFVKKGHEDKHGSPIVNQSEQSSSQTKTQKRLKIQDGEVLFELVDISSTDEEAMVQVGDQGRKGKYVNLDLRRSLSCQFFSVARPDNKSKMKRRMSF
ncbi:hypothetical protein RHSIM_RhsimUnG0205400 [Rhododendron simsii]|uniref:Transmembrane protein n=1 Tax=Rhododendron simsii TaxID=118357 RepID=A0A834FTP8_RHOSS|nr:hypothetical protein RHSIM_RhsimUnG0205400 [Rhododendron simsii]